MKNPVDLCGLTLGIFLLTGALVAMAVPLPGEAEHVQSLDGVWRFKLERPASATTKPTRPGLGVAIDTPTEFEPFNTSDYSEDGNWHDLTVPGNWEMAGFSPATYNQPDNASGFYRKWIDVPAEWNGRIVKLNFDGVQNGAEIWLNGRPVKVDEPSWDKENYHESGWTAFQADLTAAVKFGQKNLLAVRVTKNTKSSNLDSGDYFFLGGIHRTVTLFSISKTHVRDFAVRTHLLPEGKAEVKVIANIEGAAPGTKVSATLGDLATLKSEIGQNGHVELTMVVPNPKLWSAEFPNLYTFNLDLKDANNQSIERVTRRIGIREVSTDHGVFKVNGVPVKLAGVCRHDCFATVGTALTEEQWRKDITMIKAANFNAIRTSHYPYGSKFYDLCDEVGLYVADELPYCWCPTDQPDMYPAFEQRARETVRRDLNHACVVIWAIGNENKAGPANGIASKIIGELDPTRPRLSSCHPAEEAGTEFDDSHYTEPDVMAKAERDTERRSKIPRIYLESPNTWDNRLGADYGMFDLWTHVFDRTWQQIWDADHTVGCFLWEWQDRAIADKATTKSYDFDPETGVNYVKTKGLVDGFRNPRPNLYNAKMILTPIKIADTITRSGSSVTLTASNYYSFTDLAQLSTNWQLLSDEKVVGSGSVRPSLAPRSKGPIQLDLTAADMSKADTLQVAFVHPDGREIATYRFPLAARSTIPALDPPGASVRFPRLNLVTFKNVRNGIDWNGCIRTRYRLANIRLKKSTGPAEVSTVDEAALYATALADVQSTDADIVAGSDVKPFGHVHAELRGSQFSYHVDWQRGDNKPASKRKGAKPAREDGTEAAYEVQELGWAFQLPREFDHFSWDRSATWSWYPPTHIGRARGTALPDSAKANNTRVERPDAFDFVSTKYNCNWASLTDPSGAGLCAVFTPEMRQHVKAGIVDGAYQLIVNKQVGPPHDISAEVVSDLALSLSRGSQVDGSFRIGAVKSK